MENKLLDLTFYGNHDYPALVGELIGQYINKAINHTPDHQELIISAVEATYQFLLLNSTWHHEKPEVHCTVISAPGGSQEKLAQAHVQNSLTANTKATDVDNYFSRLALNLIRIEFSDKASPWPESYLRSNLAVQLQPAYGVHLEAFNLGLQGRKLVLEIPVQPIKPMVERATEVPVVKQADMTYRLLKPCEAHEMVSCMYTAYGYTYGVPDVYSHDDTAALMKNGDVVILAAEADDGEIAGVSTLRRKGSNSSIFDLCQTAVKPKFKGNRIFENLLRGVLNTAESDLMAQGLSATIPNRHLVSQDRLETAGFIPVGIFLGMVEAAFLPVQIGPFAQERESFLSVYKPLHEPNFGPLYVPSFHQPTIAHLCTETGIESPIWPVVPTSSGHGRTVLKTAEVENMKAAFIEIQTAGVDVVDQVFQALHHFKQRHFATVHLYLDLSDPTAMACCERLETMGFFFASFFPDEKPYLILQHLNNVPVLFDELLYPFPGAKQIQYHIERGYRLVQMRAKGELGRSAAELSLPSIVPLSQRAAQPPKTNNRLSG